MLKNINAYMLYILILVAEEDIIGMYFSPLNYVQRFERYTFRLFTFIKSCLFCKLYATTKLNFNV